jgi:hypothetical protein
VSEAEIVEQNARLMRREIMGRMSVVQHELGVIDGQLDDLPKPRDAEIDVRLSDAAHAVSQLHALLLQRGWR